VEKRRRVLIFLFLSVVIGLSIFFVCSHEDEALQLAPAPPMTDMVPIDTTLFAWGELGFLDWESSLAWLPDAPRLIRVVRVELSNLGVPLEEVDQMGLGLRIVGERIDWFVFLDGPWDAQKVFEAKLEHKGAGAEVVVAGTKTVRIQDRVLFLPMGSNRIIAGNDEVVASILSVKNGTSPGSTEKVNTLGQGLPDAPLKVALLQRYYYIPGVQEGLFHMGVSPELTVEGRVVCVSDYVGCDRFQKKIFMYVNDLKKRPLPEGISSFLDSIRLLEEPGKDSMRLSSQPQ
jgi:hypothetical protein